MGQKTLFVIVVCLSLFIIISIFGRKASSIRINLVKLILGDIGIFLAQQYFSYNKERNLTLWILFGVLNIFALKRIFSKENPAQEKFDEWHDDPANWKLGIFYFNKEDHRIFIPKRIESFGWTLNFANPFSIVAFIVLTILILILSDLIG